MAMNPSLRPVLGIGLVVIVVAGCVAVSRWRESHAQELIPWRTDLATAEAEAKTSQKPVFAYFTASWCPPCQEMKRTTWADPSVEEAMRRYVPVKIDIDAHHDLAQKYGVDAIPAFFVLNDAGETLRHDAGGTSASGMVAWMKR